MSLMNVGMLGWTKACCAFTTNRLPVPPGAACLPRVPGFRCWSCCWRAASAASFSPSRWRRLWPWGQRCRLVPFLFLNAALYMLVRYLKRAAPAGKQCARLHHRNAVDAGLLNLIYLLPGFVTQDARAFVLGAVCSFAGVAVFYWRRASKGQTKRGPCARPAPLCPHLPGGTALRHCVGTCGHPDPAVPRHLPFFFRQLRPRGGAGSFDFAYTLAQLVTTIQAGFSTYWGPYVYAHYRTEQERIGRIHDLLNLLIFGFFCLLVMFEDIIFIIFPAKSACLPTSADDAGRGVLHPVRRHGVRQHHCPQAVPGYDWNRRGRCGQHCRVRRAGAAFWRNGCRGRPGSGQCNDVFVPHCDRAVLLPHHPQLQPGRSAAFCWRWVWP